MSHNIEILFIDIFETYHHQGSFYKHRHLKTTEKEQTMATFDDKTHPRLPQPNGTFAVLAQPVAAPYREMNDRLLCIVHCRVLIQQGMSGFVVFSVDIRNI